MQTGCNCNPNQVALNKSWINERGDAPSNPSFALAHQQRRKAHSSIINFLAWILEVKWTEHRFYFEDSESDCMMSISQQPAISTCVRGTRETESGNDDAVRAMIIISRPNAIIFHKTKWNFKSRPLFWHVMFWLFSLILPPCLRWVSEWVSVCCSSTDTYQEVDWRLQ